MLLITGGTGFLGSHLVKKLASQGIALRCLVRNTSRASALAGLGVQLSPGDVTDAASLQGAVEEVEGIIHLVAVIREKGNATFQSVNLQGTRNLVAAAQGAGVKRFIFISNLGAGPDPAYTFLRSKWQAEEIVKASGLDYTIFRPSIVFGEGDGFVSVLARLIRQLPVTPIIGSGQTRFQPILVDNVTGCISASLRDAKTIGRIIELGGPEHLTYEQIVDTIAGTLGRRRPKLHVPVSLMRPVVWAMEHLLSQPPVTTGMLAMLDRDNTTYLDTVERNFGFKPTPLKEALDYIRR